MCVCVCACVLWVTVCLSASVCVFCACWCRCYAQGLSESFALPLSQVPGSFGVSTTGNTVRKAVVFQAKDVSLSVATPARAMTRASSDGNRLKVRASGMCVVLVPFSLLCCDDYHLVFCAVTIAVLSTIVP